MAERRVFGLGETVYDIIFKNLQPVTAKAGGSVLNALISLGRKHHTVHMITETGKDLVGDSIVAFLENNHVQTSCISRLDGQSTVALAYLNDQKDASYEFFKDRQAQRPPLKTPDFLPTDILLFGSFFGINPELRPEVLKILKAARQHGTTIVYDPNFRSNHIHSNKTQLIQTIEENFQWADIVRGSDEDFFNIYSEQNPNTVYQLVRPFCKNLIITSAAKKVHVFNSTHHFQHDVPTITPVSTIGAGDNFNAGIIHAWLTMNLSSADNITAEQWHKLITSGISFATKVCQTYDNYIPEDFETK
jgi:fructokinase